MTAAKEPKEPPKWDGLFWVLYLKDFTIAECIYIGPKRFFDEFRELKVIRPKHFREVGINITQYTPVQAYELVKPT